MADKKKLKGVPKWVDEFGKEVSKQPAYKTPLVAFYFFGVGLKDLTKNGFISSGCIYFWLFVLMVVPACACAADLLLMLAFPEVENFYVLRNLKEGYFLIFLYFVETLRWSMKLFEEFLGIVREELT